MLVGVVKAIILPNPHLQVFSIDKVDTHKAVTKYASA